MDIQLDKGTATVPDVRATLEFSPQGIGSLVTDLALARLEFDKVKKSTENPFYKDAKGRSRKYADLAEMISATAEPLALHSLTIIQSPIITDRTVGMVTLLAHGSGEWIMSTVSGCPADQKLKEGTRFDAQTIGIAMTYMARYGMRAVLNLGSEDDDGNGLVQKQEAPKPILTIGGLNVASVAELPSPSDEAGLPTPEQLASFGKRLKALNQDSRLLKTYVETKAGKSWKEIPLTAFEPIIHELTAAEKQGTLATLITPK